jgi:hypothetical protein
MIRQAFEEESMSRTWAFEWHVQTRWEQEKARQVKSKVKSMLLVFCDNKVHKEKLFWQAKQSSLHTSVMYYRVWIKMCEDFSLSFDD